MARTITTTHTRLVLSSAEREIARSWGRDWAQMRSLDRRKGKFFLLFGEWSGYGYGSNTRIVHVAYFGLLKGQTEPNIKLRKVVFTDDTTMIVWTEAMTIKEVLRRRISRRLGYTDLIAEAIRSGKEIY